ncbi:MAG: sulfatase [Deltaproteobacteria bacterium]
MFRPHPFCERGSHRRLAPLLAGLTLVLLGACQASEPRLAPLYFLEQELAGGLRADEVPICEVRSELRPSIGCGKALTLGRQKLAWPEGDSAQASHTLRAPLTIPLLIAAKLGAAPLTGSIPVAPFRLPAGTGNFTLSLPVTDLAPHATLRLNVIAYPIHPRPRRKTHSLAIPARASLTVSLGVREEARQAKLGTIRFHLSAHDEDGNQISLLDETLTPEALRSGWNDRRIDLAHLGGRKVSFHFATEATEEFAGMLPLWGAPQVLAPVADANVPNLLLISLDTMRADMIGMQLAGRPVTPFLESLIAQGTLFSSAITTFSSTTAAHMSLFTGVYPRVHGVDFPTRVLPPQIPTLARLLAQHGWETAAVTENGMIGARSGFARGFRFYRENRESTSSWVQASLIRKTFADGLSWMRSHAHDRFFFFLHTYEVHDPYQPPPEHDLFPAHGGQLQFAKHAGEAHFVDAELAKLFAALRDAGILDQTIVIITSDHGESFGEGGHVGHSGAMVESVMRVPLLVWAPGRVPAGRRIDTQISIVDLMPTILDLLGAAPPSVSNGYSLAGFLRGEKTPALPTLRFAEAPNGKNRTTRIVARRADRKWVIDPLAGGAVEAFDLGPDGREKIRAAAQTDTTEGRLLQKAFEREVADTRRRFSLETAAATVLDTELDSITAKKLKALGYID